MVSWFNSWAANLPWTCHAENTSAWRACQSQKWKENEREHEKCRKYEEKVQSEKKKCRKNTKKCEKSGKEKDEKEQERIPKRCSAVQSSRRNNGTMETQDLARLGELPMALASLRNFCPSMNLGHLSALPGQTESNLKDFSLFIPFQRLFLFFLPTRRNTKRLRIFQHLLVVFQAIHLIQFGLVIESGPGREEPHSALKL